MKRILPLVGAVAAALLVAVFVDAQPVPPIGLQRVAHDGTMTGSGTTAAPLGVTGSFSGVTTTVGDFRGTVITPTVSADQNDWAPTGHATANIIAVTMSGGSHTITGLQGGAEGRRITIRNTCVSISCDLLILTESLSSTAANRFFSGNNADTGHLTLRAEDNADFVYQGSRWHLVRPSSFDYANFANAVTFAGTGYFSGGLLTLDAGLTANNTILMNQSAGSMTVGNFRESILTISALTADQNDYAPTGHLLATVLDITPTANRAITGLQGGALGRKITIRNNSSAFYLFVTGQDAASSATNRFVTADQLTGGGGYMTLYPHDSVSYIYNGTRWVQIDKSGWFYDLYANGSLTAGSIAVLGTITANNGAFFGTATVGALQETSISPTIAADQTDWDPTNLVTATHIYVTATGAERAINGLAGGVTNRVITIHNVGAQNVLLNGGTGSVGFKFKVHGGGDYIRLRPWSAIRVIYNGTEWITEDLNDLGSLFVHGDTQLQTTATITGTLTAGVVNASGAVSVLSTGSLTYGDVRGTLLTTSISADQNDYAPTNHAYATVFEITPSGAQRTINGLAGGVAGRMIQICNPAGTAFTLVITSENAGSIATNRFKTSDNNAASASISLRTSSCAPFYYNGTRWQMSDRLASYNIIADNNVTSNGTMTVAGLMSAGTVSGTTFNMSGPVVPFSTTTTLSADQNDWTPSSFNVSANVQIDSSGGTDRTITGLTSGQTNRWVVLYNINATAKITLSHQSASSTAANRFVSPGAIDYVLKPEHGVTLYYQNARYYIIGDVFRGTGTANKISKWSSTNVVTDSGISDDGTTITTTEDINVNSGKLTVTASTGALLNAGNHTIGAGAQIISGGTPTVDHGSLSTGSTNWSGDVTSVGAFSTVIVTYSAAFPNRSRCTAVANSTAVALEAFTVTTTASAATFNCFAVLTGVAANCNDFTYNCVGQ